MVVNLREERIRVETTIGEQKETAQVAGMVELSQMQPELGRVLETSIFSRASDVQILKEKVIVRGQLDVKLLYVAAETSVAAGQNPVCAAAWENVLPYEQEIEIAGASEEHQVEVELQVDDTQVEIRSPRDLQVEAKIGVKVKAVESQLLSVAVDTVAIPQELVKVEKETIKIAEAVGVAKKNAQHQGVIVIPMEYAPMANLLQAEVVCRTESVQLGADRVFVQGICDVEILYETEATANQEKQLAYLELKGVMPFQEELILLGVQPEMIANTQINVLSVTTEWNSARELGLNLLVSVSVKVSQSRELQVVANLTAQDQEALAVRKEHLQVQAIEGEGVTTVTLQETLALAATQLPLEDVIRLKPIVKDLRTKVLDGKVVINGVLGFKLLYLGNDAGLGESALPVHSASWDEGLTFEQTIVVAGASPGMQVFPAITITDGAWEVAGPTTLRVRLMAELSVAVLGGQQVEAVVEVTEVLRPSDLDDASIIYYICQPGDSLWKISRRYGISIDALAAANKLSENELLTPGQRLFIPCHSLAS